MTSPGYDADIADNVPYIDIAGIHDEAGGIVTFFAVNRHGTESLDLAVDLQGFGSGKVIEHKVMTHTQLTAVNTAKDQTNVAPRDGAGAAVDGASLKVRLPPHSYQMLRVKV